MKSDNKYADLNSFISFLKNTSPNGTYPGDEINYVAENIQKNANVILYASLSYDKAIQFADNKLKSDNIFLEKVLRNNPNSIQYIDNKFVANHDFLLNLMIGFGTDKRKNALIFNYLPKEIKGHKEFTLKALKINDCVASWIDEKFKNDKEIVLEMLKRGETKFFSSYAQFKSDREVVLQAVKVDINALDSCDDKFKSDKEIVLASVKNWGITIKHADNSLKSDREIAYEAVNQDGWSIKHLPIELQNDKELVLKAIENNWTALKFVSEEIMIQFLKNIEVRKFIKENLNKIRNKDDTKIKQILDLIVMFENNTNKNS